MRARKARVAALLLVLVPAVAVTAPIRIGTKNFTEQFIVGSLMAVYLEGKGFDVELVSGMPSWDLRVAMESGDLHLCMEYTGTQWLTYTSHEFHGESPEDIYQMVKESDAEIGLVWLDPIWCNNTYAVAVTREFAEVNDIYDLEALAAYANDHDGSVAFATFFDSFYPGWTRELQSHYDFALDPDYIVTGPPDVAFESLIQGESVAATVFGTDSIVAREDWVVLQDTLSFSPPYDLAPVVRAEVLDENPGLEDALNELVAGFSSDPAQARAQMAALNAKVDVESMDPEDVALGFCEGITSQVKLGPNLSSLLEDPSVYVEELPEAIQHQVRETGTAPVAIWLDAPLPDNAVHECNQFKESVDESWSLSQVREARQRIFEDKSAHHTGVEEEVIQLLQGRGFWHEENAYASLAAPVLYTDLPVDPSDRWVFDELQGLDVVETIYLAGVFEPKLDSAVPAIEVPNVWERKDSFGDEIKGDGVKIAIVESGRVDYSLGCFGSRAHEARDSAIPVDTHKSAAAEVAAGSRKTHAGAAPDAILLSADSKSATHPEAEIAKSIDWALKKGADVLNASFGEEKPAGKSHAWSRLFDYHVIEHMRAFVAAAGNEEKKGKKAYVCAPASGYNVIAVGGIDDRNTISWIDDTMASFSNSLDPTDTKNEKPDVCAVAVSVDTAAYGYAVDGTSFATPAVAGTIALLIQRQPWLAVWPEVTKPILMASAIHNVTGASSYDDWEGAGTVVASEADKVVQNGWLWKKVASKSDFPVSIHFEAAKGETVRFAIAWDSHAKKTAGKVSASRLEADLNLEVRDPGGNKVASSAWTDNSFEIVEFVATATGRFEARITQARFDAAFEYVGAAWHRRTVHCIAFTSNRDGDDEIFVMNPDGSCQTQLTHNTVSDWHPAWSPDRRRIAYASNPNGVLDVFVMNQDGSNQTNLSKHSSGDDYEPSWSPDGNRIAFTSSRGNYQIYVMKDDGSRQANITSTYPHRDLSPSWSRDGRIAFQTGRDDNWEIYVMNEDGSSQTNCSSNLYSDKAPALSPDGKKIAFMSDRDGDWEIYVIDTDRSGLITVPTRLTDNDHYDGYPTWSPGGSMIAFQSYLGADYEICVVSADGSGPVRQLTDNEDHDTHPSW